MPTASTLSQNYPNPFNPTTTIHYQIAGARSWKQETGQTTQEYGHESSYTSGLLHLVSLKIYNILGQEVKTLVDEPKEAGAYTVTWDGTDEYGQMVTSGVYFYRLTTGVISQENGGSFSVIKRMVLMK